MLLGAATACGRDKAAVDTGSCDGHSALMPMYRSTDQGATWAAGDASFGCLMGRNPVDPAVVVEENGDLLLYYLSNDNEKGVDPLGSQPDDTWRFGVARSTDNGHSFVEEAIVYASEKPVADPSLLPLSDGGWRMYYADGDDILSAVAKEATAPFTLEEGARSLDRGGSPGVLQIGELTHLFICSRGVLRLDSTDGLEFTEGGNALLSPEDYDIVCDPSPVAIDDGFIMVVKLLGRGGASPFDDVVALARSPDGRSWTLDATGGEAGGDIIEIGPGSVPGLIITPEGEWVIYAVDP